MIGLQVATTVLCNVAKSEDIADLVAKTEDLCKSTGSKVWAVINNAGIGDGGALDWTDMVFYV